MLACRLRFLFAMMYASWEPYFRVFYTRCLHFEVFPLFISVASDSTGPSSIVFSALHHLDRGLPTRFTLYLVNLSLSSIHALCPWCCIVAWPCLFRLSLFWFLRLLSTCDKLATCLLLKTQCASLAPFFLPYTLGAFVCFSMLLGPYCPRYSRFLIACSYLALPLYLYHRSLPICRFMLCDASSAVALPQKAYSITNLPPHVFSLPLLCCLLFFALFSALLCYALPPF